MFNLTYKGKYAIVTGAGGMGSVLTEELHKQGIKVALLDLDLQKAKTVLVKYGIGEEDGIAVRCDVGKKEDVEAAVARVMEVFPTVDYLINTAGINGPTHLIEDYAYADALEVYHTDLIGTYSMIQTVLPIMKKQHFGAIVNIASCSGISKYKYEIAYGSSKAAVIHLTGGVAHEVAKDGIRCNCISPGWCDTPMMHGVWESYVDVGIEDYTTYITMPPLGRVSQPIEQVYAMMFLLSDQAEYVNGSNLSVDAGMILG